MITFCVLRTNFKTKKREIVIEISDVYQWKIYKLKCRYNIKCAFNAFKCENATKTGPNMPNSLSNV